MPTAYVKRDRAFRFGDESVASELFESLSSLTDKIEGIVGRLQQFDPIGERDIAPPVRMLSRALLAMLSFDKLRELSAEIESTAEQLARRLEPELYVPSRRRNRFSGWGNSAESVQRIRPGLAFRVPSLSDLERLPAALDRANAAIASANDTYANAWEPTLALFSDNEYYKALRDSRSVPYGGRQALSILRVWYSGIMSRNTGDQEHEIYGMSFRLSDRNRKNIKRTLRLLRVADERGAVERRGRAPSWTRGVETLRHRNSRLDFEPAPRPTALPARARIVTSERERRLQLDVPALLGGGTNGYASARLFNMLTREPSSRVHRVSLRWLQRRIHNNITANPSALLLSAPQQISATDYSLRAAWLRSTGHSLEFGQLLFRVGYPNCYHLPDSMLDDEGCVRADGAPSVAEYSERVLTSRANQYFRWQQQARLTYEQRRTAERKRVADIARKLRALAAVGAELTPADSYAVSNCRPGTAQFMADLGINTNRINARDILKRWRAANYIERELFGRVVDRLAAAEVR